MQRFDLLYTKWYEEKCKDSIYFIQNGMKRNAKIRFIYTKWYEEKCKDSIYFIQNGMKRNAKIRFTLYKMV